MAQGNGSSMDIDPIPVQPQLSDEDHQLRGKGLVDLEEIHISRSDQPTLSSSLSMAPLGAYITMCGSRAFAPVPTIRAIGMRFLALTASIGSNGHDCPSVIQAGGIPGCHRPILLEGRFKPGKLLSGGILTGPFICIENDRSPFL